MAETSKIEWTDSTFNPWIGCTNISPACDHCYAEDLNNYRGWVEWGPHGDRRRTSAANWNQPHKWNRQAPAFELERGRRHRVFCASLADVFDNRAPKGAREDLFAMIRATPHLDWQLLTKRPENMKRFLPADWGDGYPNVWLGVTAESQEYYDRRWPILARTPAVCRFISYEPALGPVRLHSTGSQPNWLISGGESGSKARITDPRWFRDIRDDCIAHHTAYFHKQHGNWGSNPWVYEIGLTPAEAEQHDSRANGKGGAIIQGRLWREFPAVAA